MKIREYKKTDLDSVVDILKLFVGFAGLRDLPDYLKAFSKRNKPVELYVIAVKEKRAGIGLELRSKLIEEAINLGYDEMLIFSPTTHDGSWKFHDTLSFEQVGKVTPPEDGEGLVWRRGV